jgi:hypothetical protein
MLNLELLNRNAICRIKVTKTIKKSTYRIVVIICAYSSIIYCKAQFVRKFPESHQCNAEADD